ncbi:hypothetical protein, partial [Pseudomonas viridiflava]|uniref:hypothetical protein n=1 Tax=Pseudomonas viridiflava TaxID=33069 RepID=UPI00197FAACC
VKQISWELGGAHPRNTGILVTVYWRQRVGLAFFLGGVVYISVIWVTAGYGSAQIKSQIKSRVIPT